MENNLRGIVNRQQNVLTELENEVKRIENSDLTKENAKLIAELGKLSAEYEKSVQIVKTLAEQNKSLKNALHEQIYSEKAAIVGSSKNKLEIYFRKNASEINKLTVLETSIKSKIDKMTSVLHQNHIGISDEIYQKLDELAVELNFKVTEAQKQFAEAHGAFSQNEQAEFEKLKNEQITDEQILAITKKNNIERLIGLNVLNIVGVFLIIIGAITVARLTYTHLPDELKGILMFALGGIMLTAGEILNRKKPNIFSLGITAGGVGVLYAALATSYFLLNIISRYPAFGVCVLITLTAFFLSTRYNSQTILAFALVGGYLPMFSQSGGITFFYSAMVYFILLNLLALLVAFHKRWTVPTFIGLSLNILGTAYICSNFVDTNTTWVKSIVILYILFAFLIYTLIPIVSAYRIKSLFRSRDIVLIAINTFASSLIMYVMFYEFLWDDYTGALAIIFAAIYLALGWLIERKFSGEKKMQALFYLTGMAFVVLIIPFQFGIKWLTLGWLVEGIAISVYGILENDKNFKRVGFVINGLCLFSFIMFDILGEINWLFTYKYFATTAGSVIILAAYLYKGIISGTFQKVYKYIVIVNLWFFLLHICYRLIDKFTTEYYNIYYMTGVLAIFLTFLLAYTAPRIRIISDIGVKIISMALYIIGIIFLFGLNGQLTPYSNGIFTEPDLVAIITGNMILAAICLISVFVMHDLMKLVVLELKLSVEWYPLFVSAYFVIILTQTLITQFSLSITSMWLTIIYVLTALAWIVFGFAKRYSLIRKLGLGLALMSVVKLFIIDLSSLTSGYKIASYFSLGATLIAISFVYQYFSKRLELKLEEEENA